MDWRPREFNASADHVANCVPAARADICTLDKSRICESRSSACGLQVFSDGGFVQGRGAAAFVVTSVHCVGDELVQESLGARGVWMQGAVSAFQAEVIALDLATDFVASLQILLAVLGAHQSKRERSVTGIGGHDNMKSRVLANISVCDVNRFREHRLAVLSVTPTRGGTSVRKKEKSKMKQL